MSTTPPPDILTSVLFFPFSGTSEYRKLLPCSSAPYHTILRWKIHKFSGKGHSPSLDPTPSPRTAPRFSRLRRSTPNAPVALTPMSTQVPVLERQCVTCVESLAVTRLELSFIARRLTDLTVLTYADQHALSPYRLCIELCDSFDA